MPTWQIILLQPARRYLDSLPSEQRTRVLNALASVQEDPLQAPLKRLRGREEWRLRIGDLALSFGWIDPGRSLL